MAHTPDATFKANPEKPKTKKNICFGTPTTKSIVKSIIVALAVPGRVQKERKNFFFSSVFTISRYS